MRERLPLALLLHLGIDVTPAPHNIANFSHKIGLRYLWFAPHGTSADYGERFRYQGQQCDSQGRQPWLTPCSREGWVGCVIACAKWTACVLGTLADGR